MTLVKWSSRSLSSAHTTRSGSATHHREAPWNCMWSEERETVTVNKTKRVAWHKHLKKAKKHHEKVRAQAAQTTSQRQTTPRR